MELGTLRDGRALSFDEQSRSFAVGGNRVRPADVRVLAHEGQLNWSTDEIGEWFASSFPGPPGSTPAQSSSQSTRHGRSRSTEPSPETVILLTLGFATAAGGIAFFAAMLPVLIVTSLLPESQLMTPGTMWLVLGEGIMFVVIYLLARVAYGAGRAHVWTVAPAISTPFMILFMCLTVSLADGWDWFRAVLSAVSAVAIIALSSGALAGWRANKGIELTARR